MENSRGRKLFYQDPCAEDEINLYELLMILKKRFRLILVTTLILLLGAIFYVIFTPPKYKSYGFLKVQNPLISFSENGVPITLPLISPLTVKELINYLNELLNSPDKKEIEKILGKLLVEKIIAIEAWIERKNPQLVKVEIKSTDADVIGKTFSKIYSYVYKHFETDIKNLKTTLEDYLNTLKNQIRELKKLKTKLLREGKYGEALEVSGEIADLLERYYALKLFWENYKGIEVILKPPKPLEPYAPKPVLIASVALFSGLFLGVFLVFLKEWWEENKRRYRGRDF
jgi:hypothetical protein